MYFSIALFLVIQCIMLLVLVIYLLIIIVLHRLFFLRSFVVFDLLSCFFLIKNVYGKK